MQPQQIEDIPYDERIAMSAAWLDEHKGELIPCFYTSNGEIREKSCIERQKRYPKWARTRSNGHVYDWHIHPRFDVCNRNKCPRFDPGKPPADDKSRSAREISRGWNGPVQFGDDEVGS